jgi:aminoglycoside/choline kinase family phosphotransferase
LQKICAAMTVDPQHFLLGYSYCALARNLQILGAFGYLSRVKGKKTFEKYIPRAIDTLLQTLDGLESDEFPKLTSLARKIRSI